MIVRRAAIVAAAAVLLAAVVVSAPAGANSLRLEVAEQGSAQAVNTWWVEIQPEYSAFEHDVSLLGAAFKPAIEGSTLAPIAAACKQLATSAKALQQQPPAPDMAIKKRWQAGVKYYVQGATLCVKGTQAKQTTKLIGRASHDIEKGKLKLRVATSMIKRLTTQH